MKRKTRISKFSTAHTRAVGENYFEHWCTAMKLWCILIGLCCKLFIHALFPQVYSFIVTKTITELAERAKKRQIGEKF